MLRTMAEHGERAGQGCDRKSEESKSRDVTLIDLGVSRQQSHIWQKLAAIPEDKFEAAVAAAKEVAGEVTTAALLRLDGSVRSRTIGDDECYTPAEYVELARRAMGTVGR